MQTSKLLVILIPIVLFIDLIWLGVVMKDFYSQEMGDLARRQGGALSPRWGAAILVYLLIPVGIVLFVRPLLPTNASLWQSFGLGAMFGLVLYGVFDLTNLSVIEKWTVRLALADIVWGCVLCGSSSVIMAFVDRWLTRRP
jgi:uncharacterized membrane protein